MTQDEIIRMAREACSPHQVLNTDLVFLERFAALVAAHERNRHAWTQEHWTEYEHAIAAAEREKCFDAAMKAAENAVDVAIAMEREACANVCEDDMGWLDNGGGELCAKAIRAREE